MTKEQLISDIILRVSGGKPSDDLELEPTQIAHWATVARDELVSAYLEKQIRSGKGIDPFFIEKEVGKQLNQETDSFVEPDDNRLYFEVDKTPLALANDMAVVRVLTQDGVKVDKVFLEEVDEINQLEFSKPGPENLVYYREKEKIIILGVPVSMKDLIQFTVWYVPTQDINHIDDTDVIDIIPDLNATLLDIVEKMAKDQVYGPSDIINNGQDDLTNGK